MSYKIQKKKIIFGDFLEKFGFSSSHYIHIIVIKNKRCNLNKKAYPFFPIIYKFEIHSKKKSLTLYKFSNFKETKYLHTNLNILRNSDKIYNLCKISNAKFSLYKKKNRIILFTDSLFNCDFKSFKEFVCVCFRSNIKIKIFRKNKKLIIQI